MPKETKADKNEVLRRISIVQQMIIKGFSNREIEFYAKENWNINRTMTLNYVKRARTAFVDTLSEDSELDLFTGIEQRLSLFRKMEKQGDNPKCADVALKILQDISRLKGQYIERVKVEKPDNEIDPLAPVSLTVNVIERSSLENADIQRTTEESPV
ncbi:hypothetical protein [Sphingobacterium sp.]|uniref:hypothetical protein n=1 Tax=Sphingobacterium sp. TaxID=341027 RepID=UPI0028AF5FA2|nr:hypothetical protein [Sphingobacterium sp.]